MAQTEARILPVEDTASHTGVNMTYRAQLLLASGLFTMGNERASLQAVQCSQFSWAESREGRHVPVWELELITALTGGYSGGPAWVCITSRP